MEKDSEDQKSRRERRFPKVLADEMLRALRRTDHLSHERTIELLKLYREGTKRIIADTGLDRQLKKGNRYFKEIPPEHFDAIQQLDIAFQKLHKFKHGGAGDYAAKDVERYMNSEVARRPRKRESVTTDEEIANFLSRANYQNSDDKSELVKWAMSEFDVGESKVRKAARKHGLTKNKKTTVR